MKQLCNRRRWLFAVLCGLILSQAYSSAQGQAQTQTVKITPIGARTGELCARDRAMLLEDPTGVRILYDPGVTVTGGLDPRLGAVDVIIVSHSHFDHIGTSRLDQDPDDPKAACGIPIPLTEAPNTTTAEIAAAKNSAVLLGVNMRAFIKRKLDTIRGIPTPACYTVNVEGPTETVVPRSSPCLGSLSFGSRRTVTRSAGSPGVQIAIVAAQHSDGLHGTSFLFTAPLGGYIEDNGPPAYDGLASGHVLTFTNGLKLYLGGDTGPTSDMATIVRGLYKANLAVLNVDGINTMGPEEAAFVVNDLIHPEGVIVFHDDEQVTTNGHVNPGTRVAQLMELLPDTPVYVPLSGRTMEFDGNAQCVRGCTANALPRSNRKE